MDIATQKRNAKKFIESWQNRGHERQDSESFWLQLLREVLVVDEPEQFINFEQNLSHKLFLKIRVSLRKVLCVNIVMNLIR